jgi:hypothetical protein
MVRAKFRCASIEHGSVTLYAVTLYAVTSGSEEDKSWSKYTPSGQLTMQIDNPPALAQFAVGDEYYLDFSPAKGA